MLEQFALLHTQIYVYHEEALTIFQKLREHFYIKKLFSYQEIGNKITYDRDLAVKEFCLQNAIERKEYQHKGVIRRLQSRKFGKSGGSKK